MAVDTALGAPSSFVYRGFVHLRVRSSFSLAESMIPIKKLVKLALDEEMPAVALTDNNNLFGALEFSEAAKSSGVQPIVGALLSVDLGKAPNGSTYFDEVLLLCQSEAGYRALCRLISVAHLDTPEPGVPQVKLSQLLSDSEGLICLWGGSNSIFARDESNLPRGLIVDTAERYKAAFPHRLYLELQRCGESWEVPAEARILDLAENLNLPLVATNDVYFPARKDQYAHDALQCIRLGRYLIDDTRPQWTSEHYFKSTTEMRELFADIPEAIENTVNIAMRCGFMVKKREPMLPAYALPDGVSSDEWLEQMAKTGFEQRFKTVISRLGPEAATGLRQTYLDRLDFELNVIKGMGFSGYFLIVSDFMKWAKAENIPVGVRGSGATSIVAWCMYITNLDPIRFTLVFERFLNPERVSMPDFDIDFCQTRRFEVIEYVKQKYGAERVAQIITFGKLQARAAVRDVGRVIGAPFHLTDKLSKLIGDAATLDEAIEREPGLTTLAQEEEIAAKCLSIARQVEGLYRHASTHAAGVIISDRPLVELLPLYKDPSSDTPVTQFHFKDAEKVGLVKFDFLGLRTLTIIATAAKLVKQTRGIDFDVDDLDFEDAGVYKMLTDGDVTGVFQLESSGMRDLLRRLKPEKIEQLIALISLYRPGPMDSIPSFIARAQGDEAVVFDHPILENVLSETYGIITYQEDVMRIARELAGYSLGEADLLRRAMGKKVKAEMDEQGARFRDGAARLGIDAATSDLIFEKCAKFAGYGFNKGHAASYAQVSYQTAYLKCHFQLEFYAACMTLDSDRIDRLAVYAKELRQKGLSVLPPDVNASNAAFSMEETSDGWRVRYGLAALKGVGDGVSDRIAQVRERGGKFASLHDFFKRCSPEELSRSVVEQLASAGAFDTIEPNRQVIIANAAELIRAGHLAWQEENGVQAGLFGSASSRYEMRPAPAPSRQERLTMEMKSVGFYLSGHPLDDLAAILNVRGVSSISDAVLAMRSGHSAARFAGVVQSERTMRSQRTGQKYSIISISDPSGEAELMVFSDLLASFGKLAVGATYVFKVLARGDGENMRLSASSVEPVDVFLDRISIHRIFLTDLDPRYGTILQQIKSQLSRQKSGRTTVELLLTLTEPGRIVTFELPGRYSLDAAFIDFASSIQYPDDLRGGREMAGAVLH